MNRIYINPEECKGCRLCAESCPKGCIQICSDINKIGYQYAEFRGGNCTACGICYYVCPELGTITVYKEDKEAVNNE